MTRNEDGYSLRRLSYPYTAKKSKMFEEDEENININNGNINENIYRNYLNQKEEQKSICKRIDFQDVPEETNKKKEKEKEIASDSQLLIPEIMKVYQQAKTFDYSFDLINVNFQDFIHNFSFENDENKNINNIQNNSSNNITNTIVTLSIPIFHTPKKSIIFICPESSSSMSLTVMAASSPRSPCLYIQ